VLRAKASQLHEQVLELLPYRPKVTIADEHQPPGRLERISTSKGIVE
jgi:hypothetical protein